MPQPQYAAPRPDASSTEAPGWWTKAGFGAVVPFGLHSLSTGAGFMHGAMNPLPMMAGTSNPWARTAQIKADQSYLNNARGADMSAGLPTFKKGPMAKGASVKLSRAAERVALRLKGSAVVPPSPKPFEYPLFGGGKTPFIVDAANAEHFVLPDGSVVAAAPGVSPPPGATPVREWTGVDELKHRASVLEAETANATRAEAGAAAKAREVAELEARRVADAGMGMGRRALRFAGRGLSNPAVVAGLLGVPLALAGVAGMDALYRGTTKGINRMAEGGRFDRAMEGLDPSAFGDPNFVERWDTDRPALQADMRQAFSTLNKYSPGVAKDPMLAREFMKRLQLDPRYKMPPEQYVKQVQTAIDMENAMQKARPSLFNEGGSYGSKLLSSHGIDY